MRACETFLSIICLGMPWKQRPGNGVSMKKTSEVNFLPKNEIFASDHEMSNYSSTQRGKTALTAIEARPMVFVMVRMMPDDW